MKEKLLGWAKYPREFTTAREPNVSGMLAEMKLPAVYAEAFEKNGAEMAEAWIQLIDEDEGLCCIIAGEPLDEATRFHLKRSPAGQKHWHLTLAVKDSKRNYLRYPAPAEVQAMLNTFFVPGMIFEMVGVMKKGEATVHLWSKRLFNRYDRAGVAESEG